MARLGMVLHAILARRWWLRRAVHLCWKVLIYWRENESMWLSCEHEMQRPHVIRFMKQ